MKYEKVARYTLNNQARSSGKISGGPKAAFLYPDPSQLKRNNVSVQW